MGHKRCCGEEKVRQSRRNLGDRIHPHCSRVVDSRGTKLCRSKCDVLLDGQVSRSCQLLPLHGSIRRVRENMGNQVCGVLSHLDTLSRFYCLLRLHLLLYTPERHQWIDSQCDWRHAQLQPDCLLLVRQPEVSANLEEQEN